MQGKELTIIEATVLVFMVDGFVCHPALLQPLYEGQTIMFISEAR